MRPTGRWRDLPIIVARDVQVKAGPQMVHQFLVEIEGIENRFEESLSSQIVPGELIVISQKIRKKIFSQVQTMPIDFV